MIVKNSKTNEFEYRVDGKLIRRSKKLAKLEQEVIALGYKLDQVTEHHSVGEVAVKKAEFSVKERFQFIEQFTKLAARGVIPSLIVTGSGGLGKTHTVLNTLQKLGLKEDTIGTVDGDFIFIKGYTTPRNLYTTLYHNNGKTIVMDDLDTAFKDPIGANILKAALDSGERRIVSWGAESKDDTVPSRFEFIGRIIFISNVELSKFPQAILSRSMLVDLTLTTDEKVDRIAAIFSEETDYEVEDKSEVLEFIRKNMSKAKDLNIRSAFNILKIKVAIGRGWEQPALYNFIMG